MNADAYNHHITEKEDKRQVMPFKRKGERKLSSEDIFILATLEKLKKDLDTIHRSLDAVDDPDLIDSFIYELNAVNMRYKVYLRMCKDKGLVSNIF
ncbi:MAG: YaaL family protein [Defluviitaleaceae bacterium]|nr:YaaL family protein [Defluviitaleaceae bacterium]